MIFRSDGHQPPQRHRRGRSLHPVRLVLPPSARARLTGDLPGLRMSRALVQIKSDSDRSQIATWARNVPLGTTVEFRAPRRSPDQNALMWSLLGQISKKVEWFGKLRSPEDWKDLATAALRNAEFVPGLTPGTLVPLGMRTSQMTKQELADLIESLYAFGAEKGVSFRELETT